MSVTGRLTLTLVATALLACHAGCEQQPDENRPTPTAPNRPEETMPFDPQFAVAIMQGAQGSVGGCEMGVVSASDDLVELHVKKRGAASRQRAKRGELIACDRLYRVVAVGDITEYGQALPGVVIDGRPVEVAGVSLADDGLLLPRGGRATFPPFDFHEVSIEAGRGRFSVKDNGAAERALDVAAGDFIDLGGRRHAVRAVVPPDPARGIVGWIEVSTTPTP